MDVQPDAGDPETHRLRPDRRKWLLVLAVSAGFTAIGAWMVVDGREGGWLVAGFFGPCTVVACAMLRPGASYLELRADGFESRHLYRRHRVAWTEVGPFAAAVVGSRPMVVYDRPGAAPSRLVRLNRALFGASDALPDTYGLDAAELAARMNARRAAASARPRA